MIPMPAVSPPRSRWLSRSEAARLLWATRKVRSPRRRRLARTLILLGLYTGSRRGVMLTLGWAPAADHGWVDLEAGIIYRAGTRAARTRKRKPPVPIPLRLRRHLRWVRARSPELVLPRMTRHVAQDLFRQVAQLAGLDDDVIIHTLRHTCATWLAQRGVPIWQAAGFLGMTVATFEQVYGHHHPDYFAAAADALGGAGKVQTSDALERRSEQRKSSTGTALSVVSDANFVASSKFASPLRRLFRAVGAWFNGRRQK
jgi:integrase